MLDGAHIHLDRIDLDERRREDGRNGDVDCRALARDDVRREVARAVSADARDLLHARNVDVAGDGDFTGRFHLFKGGHDLSGTFASAGSRSAGTTTSFRVCMDRCDGRRKSFDVWNAGAKIFGGDARFTYSIKPLGAPERARPRGSTRRTPTSISRPSPISSGSRVCASPGRATGQQCARVAARTFRRRARRRTDRRLRRRRRRTMTPTPALSAADAGRTRTRVGTVRAAFRCRAHLPIAGGVTYRFDPRRSSSSGGRFATERTNVTFQARRRGATARASRST